MGLSGQRALGGGGEVGRRWPWKYVLGEAVGHGGSGRGSHTDGHRACCRQPSCSPPPVTTNYCFLPWADGELFCQ